MKNIKASCWRWINLLSFQHAIYGILPLISVLFLVSGCVAPLTKDAVMNDPSISSIRDKMSEDEAVAVIRRCTNTLWINPGNLQQPHLGDYHNISVDRSGFVFKDGYYYMVAPGRAMWQTQNGLFKQLGPFPLPDRTIAFTNITGIQLINEISSSGVLQWRRSGVYYLIEGHSIFDHGLFGPNYPADRPFCSFCPGKDSKEFLAAVFLLCPNVQLGFFPSGSISSFEGDRH